MKPVQIVAMSGLQLAKSDAETKLAMDAREAASNLEGAKSGLDALKSFATGHPIRALGEFTEFASNMSNDAVMAFSKMAKGEMTGNEFAHIYAVGLKSSAATVGAEVKHLSTEI